MVSEATKNFVDCLTISMSIHAMMLVAFALAISLILSASLQFWCSPPLATRLKLKPTEAMSKDQLFQCMLSGNFALLMRDNFNQLASSLPEQQVRQMLRVHWRVTSANECQLVLDARLQCLGRTSVNSKGLPLGLSGEASYIDVLSHDYAEVLAWDIQQTAYLVRLARTMDFLPREVAHSVLGTLATHARIHYSSWSHFSLSALVGLRLRGHTKILGTSDWSYLSHSHMELVSSGAGWPPSGAAVDRESAGTW